MNRFSWKTSDTDDLVKIGGICEMILPNGKVILERNYQGDGVFGGQKFYDHVSKLNGVDNGEVHYHENLECIAPKIVSVNYVGNYEDLDNSEYIDL